LLTDPAERIAKVNRELEETKQRLDALRAADGGNTSDVDAAIGLAEEIARRKITAIEKPLADAAARARESAARQAATEQAAAERAYRANAKVIEISLGRSPPLVMSAGNSSIRHCHGCRTPPPTRSGSRSKNWQPRCLTKSERVSLQAGPPQMGTMWAVMKPTTPSFPFKAETKRCMPSIEWGAISQS